jgi:septal ring factor EnvC (AmiA/AmiB activator)
MSSTLSSARSRFSAGAAKPSVDASLISADQNVSADQKNDWFSIKGALLDRRILLAIALLFMFCIGVAAALAWQSSRRPIASNPQAVLAPATSSSNLEQQLEAMSSGLAVVRQSIDELASGLGQMRRDITNLQTAEQALFDKISESPPRPAAAQPPKSVPRPPQSPPVR